ncbi:MAG: protein kinase domain-containing protein [Bryobacteraceae bacterium]
MSDLPERGSDLLTGQPAHGELLAELLQAGPLEPELALRYAVAIGKVLGRAHEAGVVHGSLSPWSIVIGERGPTILQPVAQDAHAQAYTSPERIRGQPPDWRSDVFAYGAVLYEMAAGRPPFAGDPAAVRKAILDESPPSLPATSQVLAAMERVIADCLNKDPLRRRQRMQNVVTELKLAVQSVAIAAPRRARPAAPAAPIAPKTAPVGRASDTYWLNVFSGEQAVRRANRMRLLGLAAALLAVAAAGLFAGKLVFHRRTASPVLKFDISLEGKSGFASGAAISPDGRYLTFAANNQEGRRVLWLRALDDMHARVIPDTEDATAPFWSADGRAIGYFARRSLKTWIVQVAADGSTSGQSRVLCPTDDVSGGGTWNAAGTIVFSPSLSGGLYRISASGADPQLLLPLDAAKEHRSYRWPHFLPDGRHFTFFVLGAAEKADGVYVGDLDTKESHLLFASQTDAVYSGDPDANPAKFGYLLFVQDGDLYTQGFNPSILEVEGQPAVFLRGVGSVETLSLAPLSVSATGLLVYQTIRPPTHQLAWMDRDGKPTGLLGEPGEWGLPRIAPDGRRVVSSRLAPDRHRWELWLFDEDRMSPLVSISGADARSPVWSPDGTRVAFTSNPSALYDIYVKTVSAPSPSEPLLHSEYTKYLTDWSRDGRYLLFSSFSTAGTSSDVWAYSLGDHRGGPAVETSHSAGYPALSPNGRWLAYQSDASGRDEIYVQAFDGISVENKHRWQVSAGGGRLPRWRADGRELFYLAAPDSLMSAATSTTSGDFTFEPPHKLFEMRAIPQRPDLYDVSPDGQRLLVNLPYEWTDPAPITVMTNWTQKLSSQ